MLRAAESSGGTEAPPITLISDASPGGRDQWTSAVEGRLGACSGRTSRPARKTCFTETSDEQGYLGRPREGVQ